MMLKVSHLTIMIKQRTIIRDLSFVLQPADKLAVIGQEGDGKSTLLKVLINDCPYAETSGFVDTAGLTIGYMPQIIAPAYPNQTGAGYLGLTGPEGQYDSLLYRQLAELHINEELLGQKVSQMSGGEKIKVHLLKLLRQNCDVYLLDEPTNDLDLPALFWLQDFINDLKCPVIFVSHDETLLAQTANRILHLEMRQRKNEPVWTMAAVGYDAYVSSRQHLISRTNQLAAKQKSEQAKQQAQLTQLTNKVAYRQATISRGDPHGGYLLKKKMRNLKAQQRHLDSQQRIETIDPEESINLFFENKPWPAGKTVLHLNLAELKINDKMLAHDIRLDMVGPVHAVIIGANGLGKTTLLKQIAGLLRQQGFAVGYMPQNYEEALAGYASALAYLQTSGTKEETGRIRTLLGSLKLTSAEMIGPLDVLSGGSQAKVVLAKMVLNRAEILLLDEPSRNMSPLSNPIIRAALKAYPGPIIAISHDRRFIKETADVIYQLNRDGLTKIEKDEIVGDELKITI